MALTGYNFSTVHDFVGRELGVSEWITVDQESINKFAECTGDHQWIHLDRERSEKESPYGTTIAHGFLTLSLLSQLQFEVGISPPDVAQMINFGLDRVRFISPVKSGSRIRDRVVLMSAEEKGEGRVLIKTQNTVEIEDEAKPAMVAEALSLLMAAR